MWKAYGIIFFFAAAYWIARFYAMSPYWDGTDGNGLLANIFLHNIHGPYYLENARVNGLAHFAHPSHPAILYEIPRLVGALLTPLFHLDDTDPITCAISLKLVSALTQFIFFGTFLWLGLIRDYRYSATKYCVCSVFILASLSPVALMSSDEFQTDSLSGAILIGCATLLLIASSRLKNQGYLAHFTLVCVGLLLGFGKNEWSVAFLTAIFSVVFVGLLNHSKKTCLEAGSLGVGLIWGNLLSCEIDPVNYWGGWSLILDMVTAHSAVGAPRSYHFFNTFTQILPYTITMYVLIGFILVITILNREMSVQSLMLFFSGIAMLIGYSLSSWSLVSRYFFPSLLLLLGSFYMSLNGIQTKKLLPIGVLPIMATLLVSNFYFDFILFKHAREIRNWKQNHGVLSLSPLGNNQVYLLDVCYLLPKVNRDFIHPWVGDETIVYHMKWAAKQLKFDGIKEYPPYTTLAPALINRITPPHD